MNAENRRISDAHRMIGNTLLLYVRMFFVMGIAIWTTRLLLQILGQDGYGIFSVVSGLVLLLGFFSSAMLSTVQRFLNVEVGRGRNDRIRRAFACGRMFFAILGILVLTAGETAGLWFFFYKLKLPAEQVSQAAVLYQFLLFGFIVKLWQMPYYAVIIANERMNVLAWIGIWEALLNLASVLLLYGTTMVLACYGIFSFAASLGIFLVYAWYCRRRYAEICRTSWKWDSLYMRQMWTFCAWSIWGSIATGTVQQGLNILFNLFGGVIVNAAMGLTQQVSGAVSTFLGNFQTAFCPQIIKLEARHEHEELTHLICRVAKYSFFLLSLIVFPLLANTETILGLIWSNLPSDTTVFVKISLWVLLISSLSCPLYTAIQATGNISRYQVVIGLILITILPISYLLLRLGAPFYSVFFVSLILEVIALGIRIWFLHLLLFFPVERFFRSTVGRILPVIAVMGGILICSPFQGKTILQLLLISIGLDIILLCVIAGLGMSRSEIEFLVRTLVRKLQKYESSSLEQKRND